MWCGRIEEGNKGEEMKEVGGIMRFCKHSKSTGLNDVWTMEGLEKVG